MEVGNDFLSLLILGPRGRNYTDAYFTLCIPLSLSMFTDYCSCFCCRSGRPFHAPSLRESGHSTGHMTYDSYNHANYSQPSFPGRHGQPFQRYNHINSTSIRPMGNLQNGRSVWSNYSMAESPPPIVEGMPWGNVSTVGTLTLFNRYLL
jgi:hypothetical protein